ncbi:MAG: TonB-dependent receptor [Deltaproteobacteria bacterium]|nr:TonB-dependent receptor [Deltaproteobacteria bacterium]
MKQQPSHDEMRRRQMRLATALFLGLVCGVASMPSAWAQGRSSGRISGRVVDESGAPLPAVTVTVSGPSLQGEETEFTGEDGTYLISDLPVGEYMVRYYYADVVIERPHVNLSVDQTLAVNVTLTSSSTTAETIRITERAPTVDVGNTQIQTTIPRELVRRTPNRSLTFESVLQRAPGASTDEAGTTFNGATGPENVFLIDGLNTTNPSHGLLTSRLSLEFLEETSVITGGYQAEYGRAMGGVVNAITRSGSNEFGGEIFFGMTPFQARGKRVARLGEAVAYESRPQDKEFDLGFTLSGPVVKDRVWFFAGYHPQFSQQRYDRFIRARTANGLPLDTVSGQYEGDVSTQGSCPDYIRDRDPALCAQGTFNTESITGGDRVFTSNSWLHAYIAKLDFRVDDDNRFSIQYTGAPSRFEGVVENPNNPNLLTLGRSLNGDPAIYRFTDATEVHDFSGHYVSKLLDRKLRVDVLLGYHYETDSMTPENNAPLVRDTNVVSLSTFEPYAMCAPQTIHGVTFDPCPVSNYEYGGFGVYHRLHQSRAVASAYATYLAELAGTHEFKLGGDAEWLRYSHRRTYTGGAYYEVLGGGFVTRQGFGQIFDDASVALLKSFEAEITSSRQMLFARDSYRPDFMPGLTLNLGLRWELEQMNDAEGNEAISISDNIAPRIGLVYDLTQEGRSKIYASYGRFYEALPLNLGQRAFSKEAIVIQGTGDCATDAAGRVDVSTCQFPDPSRQDAFGGSKTQVSPVLKGQYSNQFVAGTEYDVGAEVVLGAAFIHQNLGRVIEDFSVDGAQNYFVANPGEATDESAVRELENDIARINQELAQTQDAARVAALEQDKTDKTAQIVLLRGAETLPKPKRDYNALVLSARKRFSKNFSFLASYTYGRTIGNYPGLYQASNGQLDPNYSTQYDLHSLTLNRDGPLPNDRPHSVKFVGTYYYPVGTQEGDGLFVSLSFNGQSGRPIEVLGRHALYPARESFILPRGSGGRTPFLSSFDLGVGYIVGPVELGWEVYNLFNQRQVTAVDEEYTADAVLPVVNGTIADLASLKTTDGSKPRVNPNYGQPTAYQDPLAMRFSARLRF